MDGKKSCNYGKISIHNIILICRFFFAVYINVEECLFLELLGFIGVVVIDISFIAIIFVIIRQVIRKVKKKENDGLMKKLIILSFAFFLGLKMIDISAASSDEVSTESVAEEESLHAQPTGAPIELPSTSGFYVVGQDVPTGRYMVTQEIAEGESPVIIDVDVDADSSTMGTYSKIVDEAVYIYVKEGQTLDVQSDVSGSTAPVYLTPIESGVPEEYVISETEFSMPPGMWVVGTDFPAGNYTVNVANQSAYLDVAYVEVEDGNGNQIAGNNTMVGENQDPVTIELVEGQVVETTEKLDLKKN